MKRLWTSFLVFALVLIAFSQVDPTRLVATVNGEEIRGNEYYHRMEFLPGVGKRSGNSINEFPPGFLTLEQLITGKLVFQLSKERSVYPSDLQVQDEIAQRLREQPNLVTAWTSSGRTESDLRYQIRFELAELNLATFGITVSDQEVTDFYKQNPTQFTTPKMVKLRVIVVQSTSEKDAVDAELKAGKSFADIATAHSQDVTRQQGGDYGTVPYNILSPNIRDSIEKTAVGNVTDWIGSSATGNAAVFAKFKVENVLAPVLQPLTSDLRFSIRRKLSLQRGSVKNDVEKELRGLRAKASIDIKEPVFADAFQKFVAAYLKEHGN